jgi:cation transport regulator ChaB
MPASRTRMPRTLEKSPAKARRTYAETLQSAEKTYDGDEERAHRAAFASVKHSFEKVGDHWEPKKGGRKGPSDERAKVGGRSNRGRSAAMSKVTRDKSSSRGPRSSTSPGVLA